MARGKRVLFVCEKRAAIDVVFHRLRQQGLDELCCLIHDSQTDKKAFIQNLKQTYESFSEPDDLRIGRRQSTSEGAACRGIRIWKACAASPTRCNNPIEKTGLPLRSLLHRLVETCGTRSERPPEVEDSLPDYALWDRHGDTVSRLRAALEYLGEDLCFANHPLRWLGKGVLESDRPLETFARGIDQAEDCWTRSTLHFKRRVCRWSIARHSIRFMPCSNSRSVPSRSRKPISSACSRRARPPRSSTRWQNGSRKRASP